MFEKLSNQLVRDRLQEYMLANDLRPVPWSEKAGLGRNTLRTFMNDEDRGIRVETLQSLADEQKISVVEMLKLIPDDVYDEWSDRLESLTGNKPDNTEDTPDDIQSLRADMDKMKSQLDEILGLLKDKK